MITRSISIPYTIPAGGNASLNLYTAAVLNGYTPIGVIQYKTNSPVVFIVNLTLDNSSAGVFLHNVSQSQQAVNFEAVVLYSKD